MNSGLVIVTLKDYTEAHVGHFIESCVSLASDFPK